MIFAETVIHFSTMDFILILRINGFMFHMKQSIMMHLCQTVIYTELVIHNLLRRKQIDNNLLYKSAPNKNKV